MGQVLTSLESCVAIKSTIDRIVRASAPVLSTTFRPLAERLLAFLFTLPLPRPVRRREAPLMASAQRSTVPFGDGRELAVYTWGQGPTVLLVHGWSGRASQLAVYAAPLVQRGIRVVAFDGPSHGASTGRHSALPEFAVAVERVSDAVGPVFGIVAHSLGSAATTLAVSRGIEVERLVYLAPPEDLGRYLARTAATLGFTQAVARGAQRRLERRYGVPFDEARGRRLAPAMTGALLVLHSRDDREVLYQEGRAVAEAWPGATLVTLEGLGHTRLLGDATVIERVVSFLADQGETTTVCSEAGGLVSEARSDPSCSATSTASFASLNTCTATVPSGFAMADACSVGGPSWVVSSTTPPGRLCRDTCFRM